ncbi:hypothetical protein RHSIM_Rhsim02G0222900 [Rhododendron simsii]|uniref:KIB1-4 beta-propeller domain-containing protein n=1 Tax=Rhododendron simsii TaxID=118357 RepID=A0A834HG41_RHOSS|nr:hypothetical protein RHSIM_Rhsim02G0222900 [Rhododendron simsii]
MGNWAQLLEELLVGVAERIPLMEDLIAFGGVCRSWRSVATKQQNFKGSQQVPWLMLSEEEEENEQGKVKDTDERRFVSLTKGGMIRRTALPEARGKRCLETLGWFVTVSKDGEMSLLHPFSRVEIPLPHINTFKNYVKDGMINNFIFIRKAALSSSPDSLGKSDYVLMVSYGGCGWLGFWRPGDKTWTTIESRRGAFCDISYYNGKFYGVDYGGSIFACDVGGPIETVAEVVGTIPREFVTTMRPYLVESEGVLLVVLRDGDGLDFLGDYGDDIDFDDLDESMIDYGAEEFRVLEMDLNNGGGGWREKKSLGAKAVFLGDNASISVEASKFLGIKANCIYYTDDCWEPYQCFKRGGGKDMGIYNLEDESQTPFYKGESFSPICPPIWVNPSF